MREVRAAKRHKHEYKYKLKMQGDGKVVSWIRGDKLKPAPAPAAPSRFTLTVADASAGDEKQPAIADLYR